VAGEERRVRIVVTGANGYIGRGVLRDLAAAGHGVVPAVRARDRLPAAWRDRAVEIGDIGPQTDWSRALEGAEAVVDLVMAPPAGPLDGAAYVDHVVARTRRLAEAAMAAGVGRFVYMSSVKAIGESTPAQGVTEAVEPRPEDAYGRATLAAEAVISATGMRPIILRPPAVYGPGSAGNIRRLIAFLAKAPPVLPLGITANRRSIVHRDTLASAVTAVLAHPKVADRAFFVTDGPALSTADLVRQVVAALGRRVVLLPVPAALVRRLGGAGRRLAGSLALDDSAIRRALAWAPPFGSRAGLADAVRAPADPLLDAHLE
jgi:UDP-glucose 4-epimerase